MNIHLPRILWTYEKQNNPTIAVLAREIGNSEYYARKAKKEAIDKGLVAGGQLTKLGQLVSENLNNGIVIDYLNGKITKQTIGVIVYNIRPAGVSTCNIPNLVRWLNIETNHLMACLRWAESRELIGIAQCADLNNITYRNGFTASDALEVTLRDYYRN